MIKCKVIKEFSLQEFNKLSNIKRASARKQNGKLYLNDTFECDKEMADYLMGNNKDKEVVVRVVEVEPIKKIIKKSSKK